MNTLVWFILRLDDQGILGSDGEEILSNGTKSPLCLFVEERNLDIYVMQVFILHHNILTNSLILHQGMNKHVAGADARHSGLQHLLPHLGDPGR